MDKPKRYRNPSAGGWTKWRINSNGYVVRSKTENGLKLEEIQHRILMEEFLGRKLFIGENVHHINGIRNDNRIENLELWSTRQPSGQRVEDKTDWAIRWLTEYRPELLASQFLEEMRESGQLKLPQTGEPPPIMH